MSAKRKALICGITSDVGKGIRGFLEIDDWQVFGTSTRSESRRIAKLDLSDSEAVRNFTKKTSIYKDWSLLCFFAGTMAPIGPFFSLNFDEWEKNLQINLLSQLRLLHSLWDFRSLDYEANICFLAGGGTNSSFDNYSAYCLTKVALIKFVELLASEYQSAKVFIIGPGFMRTKIHHETIRAGKSAGQNLAKTNRFLETEGTSIADLYSHLRWCLQNPKEVVSGRNFSTVHDPWRNSDMLASSLVLQPHAFKLRRQPLETD